MGVGLECKADHGKSGTARTLSLPVEVENILCFLCFLLFKLAYYGSMKTLFLPVVFLGLITVSGLAQSPTPSPTPNPNGRVPLWICVTPAGTYEVALRSMVSVSSCEYIVDGIARVNEVNIDTTGNMAVRFYYIEPMTPNSPIGLGQSIINKAQDLATEGAERTGQDEVWKKVVKNYPTTTHAHTIEYRVDSKDDLDKIFTSAELAFRTSVPSSYVIPGSATSVAPAQ